MSQRDIAALRPAAQYLRMSTDQQRYSTENQAAAIQVYAEVRGLEIVATYRDEGKSGLAIEKRSGLQALIKDVEFGNCPFSVILVYDISRWGRFQDTDESAYYEFICRRAGISVEYCAEPFENDGSPLSTIVKSIKRAMAAEYSRELSTKVFVGQKRLIQKGFLLGGMSGYGFRRQIVDSAGKPKVVLTHGQWKNIREDRIVLIPGPREELDTIRWIFDQYIGGAKEQHIARDLRNRGLRTDNGKPFTPRLIHTVLTSERYTGVSVWNRTSSKLMSRRVQNRPDEWVICANAFPALIDQRTFEAAKAERLRRSTRLSDLDMLAPLRKLLRRKGSLSIELINRTKGLPTHTAYVFRFGSMRQVYKLLDYRPPKDSSYADINRKFREALSATRHHLSAALKAGGFQAVEQPRNRLLLDGSVMIAVALGRFRKTRDRALGWQIPPTRQAPDIFVVARPDKANEVIVDYFVLPLELLKALHFNLTEHKVRALYEDYHCANLAGLSEKVEMLRNERIRNVRYDISGIGQTVKVVLDVFPPSRPVR